MTQPSHGPIVQPLQWDSDFWGVKAARIDASTTPELSESLRECRALGVRWASILVPVGHTTLIDTAIRDGFQMVDIRITLKRAVEDVGTSTAHCLAVPNELKQAEELVDGAFRISRFYVDSHLDRARCDEFYRTWVRNSFSGELADAIVVSRHEDSLEAFVTIRCDSNGSASLPLVAVRSDRRGIGVGKRVMNEALNWLSAQRADTVSVTTQLANIGAIRLYESLGFAVHETGVWLHRWLEPD